ncbi:MAG TPA: hypothetical protein V6D00_05910 [Pantanalinema sp.]
MAKIAILDDFLALARLTAGPLSVAGYDVRSWASPIDFDEVMDFGPDLIEINLYRNKTAFDCPIMNLEEDVLGFKPLNELKKYPAAHITPILLVGIGILEVSIPTDLKYDMFLSFPEDIDLYLPGVMDLTARKKGRRKVSGSICPKCKSRLTFTTDAKNLFCPRCHTAVVIIDEKDCLFQSPGDDKATPCTTEVLAPSQSRQG